jgi:plasmid maintenance system killer protein
MIIIFKTTKLRKELNEDRLMVKKHGNQRARLLKQRLAELRAANKLEDLRNLPQARCHELKHDRKGQLSVDLDGPYRLLFQPENNPIPKKPDGGLDWAGVTEVMILGVEDTHE